jgi:hypothetical protein
VISGSTRFLTEKSETRMFWQAREVRACVRASYFQVPEEEALVCGVGEGGEDEEVSLEFAEGGGVVGEGVGEAEEVPALVELEVEAEWTTTYQWCVKDIISMCDNKIMEARCRGTLRRQANSDNPEWMILKRSLYWKFIE